jgi:hypothetical protein
MNRIDQKAFETVLSIPFINGNPGNAVAYLAINAVSDHPLANEEFCRAYYAETEDNRNTRPYIGTGWLHNIYKNICKYNAYEARDYVNKSRVSPRTTETHGEDREMSRNVL